MAIGPCKAMPQALATKRKKGSKNFCVLVVKIKGLVTCI